MYVGTYFAMITIKRPTPAWSSFFLRPISAEIDLNVVLEYISTFFIGLRPKLKSRLAVEIKSEFQARFIIKRFST